MRQRLAIAQAIMEEPEILILDEPMNGLDEDAVEEIRALLLELKEKGVLIIITSHNREDIEVLCDEVYRIKKGKMIKE
jgi:ABC-2 type transport system ATP-binding protein